MLENKEVEDILSGLPELYKCVLLTEIGGTLSLKQTQKANQTLNKINELCMGYLVLYEKYKSAKEKSFEEDSWD